MKFAEKSGYKFLDETGDIARFSGRLFRESLKRHPEFNSAVVAASLLIFIIDLVAVHISDLLGLT